MEPVSEIPETSEAEVRLTAAKRQLNQELENISKMAQGKKLTRKEAAEQRRQAKARFQQMRRDINCVYAEDDAVDAENVQDHESAEEGEMDEAKLMNSNNIEAAESRLEEIHAAAIADGDIDQEEQAEIVAAHAVLEAMKARESELSIAHVAESRTTPFTLGSPRSLEACKTLDVSMGAIQFRSLDVFLHEAEIKGLIPEVGETRFENNERKRRNKLRELKKEYRGICMARWKAMADRVLSDLHNAVDQYMYFRMGVYHPDVGVELHRAIKTEGRHYLQNPPSFAKGLGNREESIHVVKRELHAGIFAVIERENLLEPAMQEWACLASHCSNLVHDSDLGDDQTQIDHSGEHVPTLEFEEIVKELGRLFPNASESERMECAQHGLALSQVQEPQCKTLDWEQIATNALPMRAVTARSRQAHVKSQLTPPSCTYCRALCKQQPALECARCKSKTYCSHVCRRKHWDAGHERECVTLQQIELQACNLARSWLQRSMNDSTTTEIVPADPLPIEFQSVETELTTRWADQDWRGVLGIESQALAASLAIRKKWPIAAFSILSMLFDCHKFLCNHDKAVVLLKESRSVIEAAENMELEAKFLEEAAEFYLHSCKDIPTALEYWQDGLAVYQRMGDSRGAGNAHTNLGRLHLLQNNLAEALMHNEEALMIAKDLADKPWVALLENTICDLQIQLNRFDEAEKLRHAEQKRLRFQLVDLRRQIAHGVQDRTKDAAASEQPPPSMKNGPRSDASSLSQVPKPYKNASSLEQEHPLPATPALSPPERARQTRFGATEVHQYRQSRVRVVSKKERPRTTGFPLYSFMMSDLQLKKHQEADLQRKHARIVGSAKRLLAFQSSGLARTDGDPVNQTRVHTHGGSLRVPVSHDLFKPSAGELAALQMQRLLTPEQVSLQATTTKSVSVLDPATQRLLTSGVEKHKRELVMELAVTQQATAMASTLSGKPTTSSAISVPRKKTVDVLNIRSSPEVVGISDTPFLQLQSLQVRKEKNDTFIHDNATRLSMLEAVPRHRKDCLTTATSAHGLKVPGWLPGEATKPYEDLDLDRRFPRSPVKFVSPKSVASRIRVCDQSLESAKERYFCVWDERQPDTTTAEREARRREEEAEKERLRQLEAAEEARRQKERDRDESIRNNEKRLQHIVTVLIRPHLARFRVMVNRIFLSDRTEFESVVRQLATEMLPSSRHDGKLSMIQAAALLFHNLGAEREAEAKEHVLNHVDQFLHAETKKLEEAYENLFGKDVTATLRVNNKS